MSIYFQSCCKFLIFSTYDSILKMFPTAGTAKTIAKKPKSLLHPSPLQLIKLPRNIDFLIFLNAFINSND